MQTDSHRGIALSGFNTTPPSIIRLGGVVRLGGPFAKRFEVGSAISINSLAGRSAAAYQRLALLPKQREQQHAGISHYIVGSDGHFQRSVPLDCADDNAVMEQAKQLVDGHDVELWQRDRKIAKFDRQPKIQF